MAVEAAILDRRRRRAAGRARSRASGTSCRCSSRRNQGRPSALKNTVSPTPRVSRCTATRVSRQPDDRHRAADDERAERAPARSSRSIRRGRSRFSARLLRSAAPWRPLRSPCARATLLRTAYRNATPKITTISPSDSHFGTSKPTYPSACRYSMSSLMPTQRDDDERAVDERRIALDERQQLPDHQPHRDDAEDAAGQDHPQLRRHRHGDEDRVDGEDDVGQLDLDDRRPERATARTSACAFGGVRRRSAARRLQKWLYGQVQQVAGAERASPRRAGSGRPRAASRARGTRRRRGCRSAAPVFCSSFGRPSTRTASTMALSALSSPSRATRRRDGDEVGAVRTSCPDHEY